MNIKTNLQNIKLFHKILQNTLQFRLSVTNETVCVASNDQIKMSYQTGFLLGRYICMIQKHCRDIEFLMIITGFRYSEVTFSQDLLYFYVRIHKLLPGFFCLSVSLFVTVDLAILFMRLYFYIETNSDISLSEKCRKYRFSNFLLKINLVIRNTILTKCHYNPILKNMRKRLFIASISIKMIESCNI